MLTKSQIQRAAQKNGVGAQVQERDYLQHVLLWILYSRGQKLVLGGGTAVRTVYGGNRYSEGLEFHGPEDVLPAAVSRQLRQEMAEGLEDFGIMAEMRNDWASVTEYGFDVGFRGPLDDGRDRANGKVRISVNRGPEQVEAQRELVTSQYDDVRPYVVTVLTPEQLMAEKVRALMVRGRPRDLYDLWLMLGLGVQPEHQLIARKLASYGIGWHLRQVVEALDAVQLGWERDLRHLLPQYVPHKVARDGVVAWLVGI
jgi:predicted nucleotidyltransferase component of viral defense system